MPTRYVLGRALQVMGMAVVLVGLALSVSLGLQEEGLSSMQYEMMALLGGGILFVAGRLIQGKASG
ncbi:MAG: hypothetical protein EYC70_11555 [Planctomycetota bacterium]|nr:MAG: hypothetical protein EYC70_11555 [Planctomycetota bacterium]